MFQESPHQTRRFGFCFNGNTKAFGFRSYFSNFQKEGEDYKPHWSCSQEKWQEVGLSFFGLTVDPYPKIGLQFLLRKSILLCDSVSPIK
jgi:hypothetical protein